MYILFKNPDGTMVFKKLIKKAKAILDSKIDVVNANLETKETETKKQEKVKVDEVKVEKTSTLEVTKSTKSDKLSDPKKKKLDVEESENNKDS